MLGILCDMCGVQTDKSYRARNYHKYLSPPPSFDPRGFPVAVVKAARELQDEPSICFNGKRYQFSDELKEKAEAFLRDIDSDMNQIAGYIEPALRCDFAEGLQTFKVALSDKVMEFDDMFVEFEHVYSAELLEIYNDVFSVIEDMVEAESRLTTAEEEGDILQKQIEEATFVRAIEAFLMLYAEVVEEKYTAGEASQNEVNISREYAEPIPDRSLELAEATIFYEYKVIDLGREDWLDVINEFIRTYLELRVYVSHIPVERLSAEYTDNKRFMTLLRAFHRRAAEAFPALEFVSHLPMISQCKSSRWMTKASLTPELQQLYQRKLEKTHAA
ncbi:hypothetical protein Pmar_PMAR022703 [Perkinsus marinus ATCC 50983]|uniref:Uncharacterized protein n=1 Tax=Perkinsus marinus (strain ATCC 50983 / TXsc) TaxID=423536 RepID=C5K846_PERM5|nr:hypothetical protein Pmar_PMAR022703 [Perkinsus marinus ATCC 50983]EER19347.1 hypothetical protein Pmar_PMAR022703 [Perkinsus marinus ATCC 50983]|eukprot:XP_002787551.1 hypothetical protein Pmar_PMAR022703 [Perkinsus marinus ATCC 50983]